MARRTRRTRYSLKGGAPSDPRRMRPGETREQYEARVIKTTNLQPVGGINTAKGRIAEQESGGHRPDEPYRSRGGAPRRRTRRKSTKKRKRRKKTRRRRR